MRCLLIDDDLDDCEIFIMALNGLDSGIMVETMTEAADALSLLEKAVLQPDIIFLDLNMPRTDGLTCLHQIRSLPSLSDKPVIIYSTSTNPKDVDACRKEGATDYLVKPSSIASLRDELLKIFERHYGTITAS